MSYNFLIEWKCVHARILNIGLIYKWSSNWVIPFKSSRYSLHPFLKRTSDLLFKTAFLVWILVCINFHIIGKITTLITYLPIKIVMLKSIKNDYASRLVIIVLFFCWVPNNTADAPSLDTLSLNKKNFNFMLFVNLLI